MANNESPHDSIVFPRDHSLIAVTSQRVLRITQSTRTEIFRSTTPQSIVVAKQIRDKNDIIAVSDGQVIIIHDSQKCKSRNQHALSASEGRLQRLVFISTDKLAYSTSLDGAIHSYSILLDKCTKTPIEHSKPPDLLAASSRFLLSVSETPPTVNLLALTLDNAIASFTQASQFPVTAAAFHPHRPEIFLMGYANGAISIHDASRAYASRRRHSDGQIACTLNMPALQPGLGLSHLIAAQFVPCHETVVVSICESGSCQVVDFGDRPAKVESWVVAHPCTSLAVTELSGTNTPEERNVMIAIGCSNGSILLYDSYGRLQLTINTTGSESITDLSWCFETRSETTRKKNLVQQHNNSIRKVKTAIVAHDSAQGRSRLTATSKSDVPHGVDEYEKSPLQKPRGGLLGDLRARRSPLKLVAKHVKINSPPDAGLVLSDGLRTKSLGSLRSVDTFQTAMTRRSILDTDPPSALRDAGRAGNSKLPRRHSKPTPDLSPIVIPGSFDSEIEEDPISVQREAPIIQNEPIGRILTPPLIQLSTDSRGKPHVPQTRNQFGLDKGTLKDLQTLYQSPHSDDDVFAPKGPPVKRKSIYSPATLHPSSSLTSWSQLSGSADRAEHMRPQKISSSPTGKPLRAVPSPEWFQRRVADQSPVDREPKAGLPADTHQPKVQQEGNVRETQHNFTPFRQTLAGNQTLHQNSQDRDYYKELNIAKMLKNERQVLKPSYRRASRWLKPLPDLPQQSSDLDTVLIPPRCLDDQQIPSPSLHWDAPSGDPKIEVQNESSPKHGSRVPEKASDSRSLKRWKCKNDESPGDQTASKPGCKAHSSDLKGTAQRFQAAEQSPPKATVLPKSAVVKTCEATPTLHIENDHCGCYHCCSIIHGDAKDHANPTCPCITTLRSMLQKLEADIGSLRADLARLALHEMEEHLDGEGWIRVGRFLIRRRDGSSSGLSERPRWRRRIIRPRSRNAAKLGSVKNQSVDLSRNGGTSRVSDTADWYLKQPLGDLDE